MRTDSIIYLFLSLLFCFHSFGQNYDAEILKLEKEKRELQDSILRLDSKIRALRNESLRAIKSDNNSQNYILSSVGWCYYIDSNGDKVYVDKSFCTSNNTNLSQSKLVSASYDAISDGNDFSGKKIESKTDLGKGIAVTIKRMGGILRDKPSLKGNQIANISAGETVLIFNWYKRPYFKAGYDQKFGYISYGALTENAEIKAIIDQGLVEELTIKYGSIFTAKRIINGGYWIGMTEDMAWESLGSPDDINTSEGSWGIHEQWVYSERDLYLYFEDGILTSIQR